MDASVVETLSLDLPSPLSLLPLELEYAIIGWLQDDRPAVAYCSLVCRRWRAIGQSILFHEVKIRETVVKVFPQLLHLVRARLHVHIAGYIHVLRLEDLSAGSLSFDMLRIAVGAMVHLHTLRLELLTLHFDTPTPAAALPGSDVAPLTYRRAFLKKLAIIYCDTSSPTHDISDLLSIICMFAEIDHLVIKGEDWTTLSDISLHLEHAPMVRSLKLYYLDAACVSAIHRMVRASRSLDGPMTYLGICASTLPEAIAVTDLVREAGPQLHTLKLHLRYTKWSPVSAHDVCHALDFSTCTAIRALQLHIWIRREEFMYNTDAEQGWLPSCFHTSASLLTRHKPVFSDLQTVRIIIDADHDGDMAMDALRLTGEDGSTAWCPLEAALMEMRSLARLEIIVRDLGSMLSDCQRTDSRDLVEKSLSNLLESRADTDGFFHFDCRDY